MPGRRPRGSRPDECDEAVVCVPNVYHIVEVSIGSIYLEVAELFVPVVFEFFNFSFNNACFFVLSDDLLNNSFGLLTENVCEFLCFAGLKNNVALECAAGVCVVKIGYETCAYMGLYLKEPEKFDQVVEELKKIPEVVECHYTTGGFDMFIKIYAINNHHLLEIIHDKLQPLGLSRSETIISFNAAINRQLSMADIQRFDDMVEDEATEEE